MEICVLAVRRRDVKLYNGLPDRADPTPGKDERQDLSSNIFFFSRGFTAGTRMTSLCSSVVPERDQWINLCCPPRRNPARCKSDEREKDRYGRERQRVGG